MKISVIASEGGAGYYPENTAYAVKQSLSANVDGCELDFHLTADGRFVAHHDYLLNRALTRDPNGVWLPAAGPVISHTTLAGLRQYEVGGVDPQSKIARRYPQRCSVAGERIATFEDIASAYLSHPIAQLWFEAKTDPFDLVNTTPAEQYVEALVNLLSVSPLLSRVVLIAFDWRLLELAKARLPGIQTGFLTLDFSWLDRPATVGTEGKDLPKDLTRWFGNFIPARYGNSIPRAVTAAGGTYWSPYFRDLSVAAVDEAHALGIKVSTWGADAAEDIAAALAMGVDSLTTGYVDRAQV